MAKSSRAYRSAKRSRELDRLRKQEEKRRRRQHKAGEPAEDAGTSAEGTVAEGAVTGEASETKDTDDPGAESA